MNRNRIVVIGITVRIAAKGCTMWDASIDAQSATILCPVQISIRACGHLLGLVQGTNLALFLP